MTSYRLNIKEKLFFTLPLPLLCLIMVHLQRATYEFQSRSLCSKKKRLKIKYHFVVLSSFGKLKRTLMLKRALNDLLIL